MDSSASTKRAFFWTHILNIPFWAIYNMLFMILYRELQATPLQIVLFMTLNPVASIFSLYWSHYVQNRPDRLKGNIIWAGILGHLPFLAAPWVDSPWFFIFSSALYMLLTRGVIPAWMELFRLKMPGLSGRKLFAMASSLSYVGSALFPFFFGWLMDDCTFAWRWIIFSAGCLSLTAVFFQYSITLDVSGVDTEETFSWTKPWFTVVELLKSRPDFLRFQMGFMLGGFGLMIVKPAMPVYFSDALHISYTELGVAIALCKGVGYALTSSYWADLFGRVNIFRFISLVTLLAAFYPLFLISAAAFPVLFYVAWLGYGVMQGGSEMAWKMSGAVFSKNADSSSFTSANILMVGLRGCLAPPLGGLMVSYGLTIETLLVGSFVCFAAAVAMKLSEKRASSFLFD